jgi:hypothetical protein
MRMREPTALPTAAITDTVIVSIASANPPSTNLPAKTKVQKNRVTRIHTHRAAYQTRFIPSGRTTHPENSLNDGRTDRPFPATVCSTQEHRSQERTNEQGGASKLRPPILMVSLLRL